MLKLITVSYLPPWMFGHKFASAIEVVRKFGERAFNEPYLAAKKRITEVESLIYSNNATKVSFSFQ
jgi:hypothetical protein